LFCLKKHVSSIPLFHQFLLLVSDMFCTQFRQDDATEGTNDIHGILHGLCLGEQSCSETLEMGNGKAARAEKNWEFIIC
jgi:hypothetical protein